MISSFDIVALTFLVTFAFFSTMMQHLQEQNVNDLILTKLYKVLMRPLAANISHLQTAPYVIFSASLIPIRHTR